MKFGDRYEWYISGVLHCADGPARVLEDGSKEWYYLGMLHREGGPAVEYPNGNELWYQYGDQHREDGPAEKIGKKIAYYLNDMKVTENDLPKKQVLVEN